MIELLIGLLMGFYARDIRDRLIGIYNLWKDRIETPPGVVKPTVRVNEQPPPDTSETGAVTPPNPSFVAAQNVIENERRINEL